MFTVFAAAAEDASIWWGRHRGKEGRPRLHCVMTPRGAGDSRHRRHCACVLGVVGRVVCVCVSCSQTGIFPSECVDVLQGDPDKLVLKSVEEDDAEADAGNNALQPTDVTDSFVPLALLLVLSPSAPPSSHDDTHPHTIAHARTAHAHIARTTHSRRRKWGRARCRSGP